jgi:hypothetical protein
MNKLEKIFKAWGIWFNPNDIQSELAGKRMEICDGCDSKRTTPFIHCGECTCPLKVKVYTPGIGGCPLRKWDSIEIEWEHKKNKIYYDRLKEWERKNTQCTSEDGKIGTKDTNG